MSDDKALMAAINAHADLAEQNKHMHSDMKALATTLCIDVETKRSVEEVEAKLKDVWRARGLFWFS